MPPAPHVSVLSAHAPQSTVPPHPSGIASHWSGPHVAGAQPLEDDDAATVEDAAEEDAVEPADEEEPAVVLADVEATEAEEAEALDAAPPCPSEPPEELEDAVAPPPEPGPLQAG